MLATVSIWSICSLKLFSGHSILRFTETSITAACGYIWTLQYSKHWKDNRPDNGDGEYNDPVKGDIGYSVVAGDVEDSVEAGEDGMDGQWRIWCDWESCGW